MLADIIKGPHLDFFLGGQQPFTRLCSQWLSVMESCIKFTCK